jgi:uncharacterized protein (TIGR02391 family)
MQLNRTLRSIVARAWDGIEADQYSDGYTTGTIGSYIIRDARDLDRLWPTELSRKLLGRLRELANKGDHQSFREIATEVIPQIEDALDDFFASQSSGDLWATILDLLHPAIVNSSYSHSRSGHYRDAVFTAFVAVFELIRRRTHLDKDGAELIADAFSLARPRLIFSTLETESGKNEQKGFIQILRGAFLGVRNPKAHSLSTDLNELSAAQQAARG